MIDPNTQEELIQVEPAIDDAQVMADAQAMDEMPQEEVQVDTGAEEAGLVSDVARFIGKAVGVQPDVPIKPKMEAPAPKAEPKQAKSSGLSAWANREILKMKPEVKEKKIGELVQSKPKKLSDKQAKKKFEENVIKGKYGGDESLLTKTEKDIYETYKANIATKEAASQAQAEMAMETISKQAREEGFVSAIEKGNSPITNNLNVEKEILGLRASKIDQFNDDVSHMINFDTIDAEDDIIAIIAHMAEQNKNAIDFERRGVVSDDLFVEMAHQVGADPQFLQDMMGRNLGENFKRPEYVTASLQFLEASAVKLKEYSVKAQESMSPKDKLQFINQWNLHNAFYQKFMGARAESGRTQRAFQLSKKMKNQEDVLATLGAIESDISVDKIMRMVSDATSAEDVNKMASAYKENWSKGVDLLYAHWIGSMLSGTSTVGTIIAGNIGNTINSVIERKVAPLFPRSKGAMDEVENDEVNAMLIGYLSSVRDAGKAMVQTLKTGEVYSGFGVYDINVNSLPSEKLGLYQKGTKDVSTIGSFLDTAYKYSTFFLRNVIGSTSSFSTVLNEKAQVNAIAYRQARESLRRGEIVAEEFGSKLKELITNPSEEIKMQASEFAAQIELRETPGKWLSDLQRLMSKTPTSRWLIPFVKTLGNTTRQTLEERSIIGLNPYSKFWDEFSAGGARRQMAMTKMGLGSGYVAAAFMAAENGLITGPLSANESERKAQQDAGYIPYSFVFTDSEGKKRHIPYQGVEPFHTFFGIAATMSDYFRKSSYVDISKTTEEKETKLMANLVAAISENTLNRTFGQSLNTIFDILDNADVDGMERMWASFVNTMIPYAGMRRTIVKEMDDVKRNTTGTFDYILSQIPGLSDSLPPVRDALGREREHDFTYIRYMPKEPRDQSRIDVEVQNLFQTTRKYALTSVREILGGQKVTPEQSEKWFTYARKDFKDESGRNLQQYLEYIITEDDYKELNDYEKVEKIRSTMKEWDIAALESLKFKDKELAIKMDNSEIVKKARDFEHRLGMGIEEALNQAKEEWSIEYESQAGGQ